MLQQSSLYSDGVMKQELNIPDAITRYPDLSTAASCTQSNFHLLYALLDILHIRGPSQLVPETHKHQNCQLWLVQFFYIKNSN